MKKQYWLALIALLAFGLMSSRTVTANNVPVNAIPLQQDDSACAVDPGLQQVRYNMDATLDWNTKIVEVTQRVNYRNDHDTALDTIVFHSEPHRLSRVNTMTFNYAQDVDGNFLSDVTIDAMRITVPLQTSVEPGCDVAVTLRYAINTQPLSDSNPLGWLAYTEQQFNLGHWFPTVGLFGFRDAGEWYTPTRHYIGEQAVAAAADYELRFGVSNAPAGLTIAAPGEIRSLGTAQWAITHKASRELALSLSTGYTVYTETVNGITVEWYIYSNLGQEVIDRAMTDATQSLDYFSRAFGEYPRERLVIVEGDFPDGYEFTGMVFVSTRWFEIWNGNVMHWLTIITVHEIAHQWWYAMVGNDQSLDPYLDESLATYSEYLYFQEFYPTIADQWWGFRVNPHDIIGAVDSNVYDYTQWRPYINAVYLNGARMLNQIRNTIGDDAFMNWLGSYFAMQLNSVATQSDFWNALGDNFDSVASLIAGYLEVDDPRS